MKVPLILGPDVIERLMPHRRPFLMVDGVVAYERSPRPTLWATRHVASNEAVFEGHFPGLHLWPGVHTIEGMGQACNLLFCVIGAEEWHAARGGDPDELLEMLRNLERGFKLTPGYDAAKGSRFLDALKEHPHKRAGMSAAVEVKLLAPVFAGQRIDFCVTLTHVVDELARFEVSAEVSGKLVAKGVMKSTKGIPLLVPM
jgi:3-hydroxyacyl-[acyl-carrier-protein] dehydratase